MKMLVLALALVACSAPSVTSSGGFDQNGMPLSAPAQYDEHVKVWQQVRQGSRP